jgi:hypothetical protein
VSVEKRTVEEVTIEEGFFDSIYIDSTGEPPTLSLDAGGPSTSVVFSAAHTLNPGFEH